MTNTLPTFLERALGSPPKASLSIAELADEKTFGRSGFALSSPAFEQGEMLDPSFTAGEEDAVAPPMEWNAPPPGTQELVLIVEDADGPADSDGKAQCHWLVWGLPGQKGKILEGETPPRTGKNAKGNSEWLLPAPSADDEPHRYVFQLFALDLPMVEMPGAPREKIVSAMRGHVTAAALLVGKFAPVEEDEELDWDDDDSV
ncbi:YbhB/YbcL family Raf kinase inhibitor-like protein [Qipengyuania atrilutea]|uniref:YbhB/YbcL family Raf kinase inhibitor-like protein n=1 Tax=Qipengyuania atrilutea TaxID=2744473 RepID=A0A850H579_9SPHN|nr:YbhB/YbcL family Raf kinase inhibitor-like protein [Actirhodobacter atriluteus]NVD45816.1 YbhB/YbcL family Raf kinase inhibitor-like protein [Actirhodobacter atriluteus]